MERRGLESESRTGMRRRMEFEGAAAAEVERLEDELGGRTRSASLAALRAACRRLWGRSWFDVGGEVGESFEGSLSAAIDLVSCIDAVKFPLLTLDRALSSIPLAEKYSVLSFGVDPPAASAVLTFDVCDRFLLVDERVDFVMENKHDIQTVPRPLDRKALVGGDRIIIACRWAAINTLDIFEVESPAMRELPHHDTSPH